jgi:hypothetical protein
MSLPPDTLTGYRGVKSPAFDRPAVEFHAIGSSAIMDAGVLPDVACAHAIYQQPDKMSGANIASSRLSMPAIGSAVSIEKQVSFKNEMLGSIRYDSKLILIHAQEKTCTFSLLQLNAPCF